MPDKLRCQVGQFHLDEVSQFIGVFLIRMPAQIDAQAGFFVRQLFAQAPARHIGGLHDQHRIGFVVAEQAVLVRRARMLVGARQRRIHAGHQRGAMIVDAVECAGTDQRLDGAPVDDALVHAPAEVEQVLERAVRARLDDAVDRRLACALDRAQPVGDGLFVNRREHVARAVHVRRQHMDRLLQGIGVKDADFFGVVQIA